MGDSQATSSCRALKAASRSSPPPLLNVTKEPMWRAAIKRCSELKWEGELESSTSESEKEKNHDHAVFFIHPFVSRDLATEEWFLSRHSPSPFLVSLFFIQEEGLFIGRRPQRTPPHPLSFSIVRSCATITAPLCTIEPRQKAKGEERGLSPLMDGPATAAGGGEHLWAHCCYRTKHTHGG